MKQEIIITGTFCFLGFVASFWNPGQLLFTAIPSGILCVTVSLEYRREKKRKKAAQALMPQKKEA